MQVAGPRGSLDQAGTLVVGLRLDILGVMCNTVRTG
jgi:hypothetical protein